MKEIEYKIKSVMIGHAVGDALGVPVEFASRDEITEKPVTDMEGFGTYPYPAGTWSDDTSMSIAALESLASGEINWEEIMDNFGKWLDEGKFTPSGEAFDVGRTCLNAIITYFNKGTTAIESGGTGEHSNGNGSLMRIHPFALYEYIKETRDIEVIHNASALTHAHERSKIACGIYSFVLWELLKNPSKSSIRSGLNKARIFYRNNPENCHYDNLYRRIGLIGLQFEDDPLTFHRFAREDIKSSGYVVDTIEAAIWCLMNTRSYKECVLTAVNLGDDTDTVAAIAGGLAGALYGYDGIPQEWRDTLIKIEYIEGLCKNASTAWEKKYKGTEVRYE